MLKIENIEVQGWKPAIRGMRNPKNSWDRSDTLFYIVDDKAIDINDNFHDWPEGENAADPYPVIGPNDHKLMMSLAAGGAVHAKYRRMIVVWCDITAPLYWWKEFDTYKVGTVANSCSTMHKIAAKPFELDDFSHEHLIDDMDDIRYSLFPDLEKYYDDIEYYGTAASDSYPMQVLYSIVECLNMCRGMYRKTKDKRYWWQMIQLLPSSYNQKRTVMLNYEVLAGIYPMRKDHKLDEWHVFCDWIKSLPYSELIIGKENDGE